MSAQTTKKTTRKSTAKKAPAKRKSAAKKTTTKKTAAKKTEAKAPESETLKSLRERAAGSPSTIEGGVVAYCHTLFDELHKAGTERRKDYIVAAVEDGVNYHTASTQYQLWTKGKHPKRGYPAAA